MRFQQEGWERQDSRLRKRQIDFSYLCGRLANAAAKRPLTQRKIVLTKVLAPFMISMAVPKTMDTQAQEIEPVRATTKMKPMMGQSS